MQVATADMVDGKEVIMATLPATIIITTTEVTETFRITGNSMSLQFLVGTMMTGDTSHDIIMKNGIVAMAITISSKVIMTAATEMLGRGIALWNPAIRMTSNRIVEETTINVAIIKVGEIRDSANLIITEETMTGISRNQFF